MTLVALTPFFLLTVPRRCFLCGYFCYCRFIYVFVYCPVCSLHSFSRLLGKDWPLGSLVYRVTTHKRAKRTVLTVFLSLSHIVYQFRCGTLLYRFLVFTCLLTLKVYKCKLLSGLCISELNIFCTSTIAESMAKIWYQ